jgi:polyhydroxyalkanoate synthesis regulator phasin
MKDSDYILQKNYLSLQLSQNLRQLRLMGAGPIVIMQSKLRNAIDEIVADLEGDAV